VCVKKKPRVFGIWPGQAEEGKEDNPFDKFACGGEKKKKKKGRNNH